MFRGPSDSRSLALSLVLWSVVTTAGTGCDTRDRLTFPSAGGGDQVGPSTVIDAPKADTTVPPTPVVFVNGRTLDEDGLDTIYFETEGGKTSFAPFIGGGTAFRFGLPITADSTLIGHIITVRVFATDRLGNRGDTAVRRITVQ
jgi:hypothetical protein